MNCFVSDILKILERMINDCDLCHPFYDVCIGNFIWFYLFIPIILLFILIIITVYIILYQCNHHNKLKVKAKFVGLAWLCHILLMIALVSYIVDVYLDNYCQWYYLDHGITQSLRCYTLGCNILIIIFIERLYDAVKGTLFAMSNKIRICVYILVFFNCCTAITLMILYSVWIFSYDPTIDDYVFVRENVYDQIEEILWYTERSLYILTTLIVLCLFIKRFNTLKILYNNKNRNNINHSQVKNLSVSKLNRIIVRQTLLVSISLISSIIIVIIVIIAEVLQRYTANWEKRNVIVQFVTLSRFIFVFYMIDCFVNIVCLHCNFPYSLKLYQLFGCQSCAKKVNDNCSFITQHNVQMEIESVANKPNIQ